MFMWVVWKNRNWKNLNIFESKDCMDVVRGRGGVKEEREGMKVAAGVRHKSKICSFYSEKDLFAGLSF